MPTRSHDVDAPSYRDTLIRLMPAIALLAPEVWEALKLANIRGSTDEQLSRQFDVSEAAIRKRRSRDPAWQGAMVQPAGNVTRQIQRHANVTGELAKASVTDSLLENGQKSSLLASQLVLAKLQKAADNPHTLKDLADVSDIKTAMSVARIAGGLDKEGGEVKVNLAMFTGDAQVSDAPAAWEIAGQVVESGPD